MSSAINPSSILTGAQAGGAQGAVQGFMGAMAGSGDTLRTGLNDKGELVFLNGPYAGQLVHPNQSNQLSPPDSSTDPNANASLDNTNYSDPNSGFYDSTTDPNANGTGDNVDYSNPDSGFYDSTTDPFANGSMNNDYSDPNGGFYDSTTDPNANGTGGNTGNGWGGTNNPGSILNDGGGGGGFGGGAGTGGSAGTGGTAGPGGAGGSGGAPGTITGGGGTGSGGGSTVPPGTVVNQTPTNPPKAFDPSSLISAISGGQAAANKANKQTLADLNESINNSLVGNNDAYAKMLGLSQSQQNLGVSKEQERLQQQQAATEMQLANEGLGGSTAAQPVLSQQARDSQMVQQNLTNNDLQNQLNLLNQQNSGAQNIQQQKRSILQGVTNQGPDVSSILPYLMNMAQNNTAAGANINWASILNPTTTSG